MYGGLDMVVRHHKLPLLLIIAFAVIFLMPPWITAQGTDYYYGSNYYPLTSNWEQRLWYAEAFNFLDNNCEYCSTPYSSHHPPYAGNAYGTSANSQPTYKSSNVDQNAISLLNDANVLYLNGSYQQAAGSYAKAVNIDPSLSEGWLNLGNSLYFLGRYQESLNAYVALLNQEPTNANALEGKNMTLSALNKSNAIPF
jgi:tetratricopeptide (TPR) repeat protein